MKPSLIVLGAPGSGKGTQADKLSKYYGMIHLSTGDLLRSEIEKGSELGLKVKDIISKGELVSDDIVLSLLKLRFQEAGVTYILDGFPRNLEQSKMLTSQLGTLSLDFKAIFFNVDLAILQERIVNRRTCKKCGEIYNLKFKPLSREGLCVNCGSQGEIVHRKDDTVEVVENRLRVFKEQNDPIVDYYKKMNKLVVIDAQKSETEVFEELKKIINSLE